MKIVENTNIANLSPLASAIYDKLAHNQQMLFLTWECEDDELTNQVAHFLNHFDAAIAHLKGKVEFMLPLTAFHLMAHRATSKWPTDEELCRSLAKIAANHTVYWRAGRFDFNVSAKPIIYGIMNITPDSFYDGGRYNTPEAMREHIRQMVAAGADVIEVNGQTTKPGGYKEVSPEEELARIVPGIKMLQKEFPNVAIAVDTYKLPVMEKVLAMGVDIINDVRAFDDQRKLLLLKNSRAGLVTMHSSRDREYGNLTVEMKHFFEHNLAKISEAGINLDRVIIDEGIGYSKVADGEQDYAMMRNIDEFRYLNRPIMVAISRKGFGKKLFDLPKDERLPVTLIAETYMYLHGGRVLRVHDIEETRQLVKMIDTITAGYWQRG
ncbi:dihydropteroate synthase [Limosilactobacillus mucosae]|mgnify:FL=1|jgi:dihydropteroate synthase|uniref:dihydropteroate synthase n=1 Tax=Limosilactobacillus mucosae TaxID=97478 RepID=UPI0022E134E5|nr:dihydropteroate synthase [Limosilactobacillus mucosae]